MARIIVVFAFALCLATVGGRSTESSTTSSSVSVDPLVKEHDSGMENLSLPVRTPQVRKNKRKCSNRCTPIGRHIT
jgi:hypothetical protein